MTHATSTRSHVLVVEDEDDLRDLLRYNLEREGMRISCAATGEDAIRMAEVDPPNVVLLDLMLPSMDGLEVCRTIRSNPNLAAVPIIMVTAKGEEADGVVGLEMGADDYVSKPFSPRVLLARVKSVLRRRGRAGAGEAAKVDTSMRFGELTIDPDRHEVWVADKQVQLTATEFRLLSLIAQRPGRVFTRQQIIDGIHGSHVVVTERSVDVQVVSLRRKLGKARSRVETVHGVGYRFKE
jgi:two-component system phosphate regulon response regulator PhoB